MRLRGGVIDWSYLAEVWVKRFFMMLKAPVTYIIGSVFPVFADFCDVVPVFLNFRRRGRKQGLEQGERKKCHFVKKTEKRGWEFLYSI